MRRLGSRGFEGAIKRRSIRGSKAKERRLEALEESSANIHAGLTPELDPIWKAQPEGREPRRRRPKGPRASQRKSVTAARIDRVQVVTQ